MYYTTYDSELIGKLYLVSNGEALTCCWMDNDRFHNKENTATMERKDDLPIFDAARNWLDRYFAGKRPQPSELPLAAEGTEFRQRVWNILAEIPYGQTITYGDIARRMEQESGRKMSAQAVGGAVGHNPIGIIVPCHRVMGAGGNLTGFGGGIDTKIKLLEHEQVDMSGFYTPKKGTAL